MNVYKLLCIASSLSFYLFIQSLDIDYSYSTRQVVYEDERHENSRSADLLENYSEPIVASLGWNCEVSLMLRKLGLREFASPFDWIQSSFNGVCDCFENNFIDFLNPNFLVFQNYRIVNLKFTFHFMHDFSEWPDSNGNYWIINNWVDELNDVQIKYSRRIERLLTLLHSGSKIYLFRMKSHWYPIDSLPQNKQNIEKLKNILIKKFPQSNFVLVALGSDDEYRSDWNMPCVRNFYISDINSLNEWNNILNQLAIIH